MAEVLARNGQKADSMLERPIYLMVVFWGEQFRNYFLEYCLPSLLSPGNIPSLATRQPSKFLIATRPEDWAAMRATAIFKRLETHVDAVYLEIPACPPDRHPVNHMGIGHKLACEMCFRDKAYAILAYPDCVFSDGTIARVQELAREGKALVVCPALRFGEEPVLRNLRDRGLIPAASRRQSGEALVLPARELADAGINGLHTETLSYEWNAPYFGFVLAAVWWRIPNEDGMLLHCLNWSPLLLDCGAMKSMETSMLDYWTIDGDFLQRNVEHSAAIHIVDDSDEAFLVSWAPMADKLESIRSSRLLRNRVVRELIRAVHLWRVYYGPETDELKRRLFLQPIRWHSRPLNEGWQPVERKARQTLDMYIGEARAPDSWPSDAWRFQAWMALVAVGRVAVAAADPLIRVWFYRRAVRRRLGQVVRGDPDARRRVFWHIDRVVHQLFGRAFNRPMPRPPA
jgi:hypothetical protein